jgi:ssDNA-binding Zn-finger/Zn-ribbon topoisomerase 1
MYFGDKVFISYRGKDYVKAQRLKQWLESNHYCQHAILYPPNTVATADELLRPYDFFELLAKIVEGGRGRFLWGGAISGRFGEHEDYGLQQASAFIFLETDNYWESSFTQAEAMLWSDGGRNTLYPAHVPDVGTPSIKQGIFLASSFDVSNFPLVVMWADRKRNHNIRHGPTYQTGRYAKSCFIFQCPNCKQYSLISKKAIRKSLEKKFCPACPHCGNSKFHFVRSKQWGHFYDNQIFIHHTFEGKPLNPNPNLLIIEELVQLLETNDLPPSIGLIALPNEKFKSDFRAYTEGVLAYFGFLVVLGVAVSLSFRDDKE